MLNVLKLMFPYLRPFWKKALFATLLSFPLAGIKAYEAFLVKDIFDKGFAAGSSFDDARNLALLLIALGFINYPLRYLHYFTLRQIVDKSTRSIRGQIYKKFQNLPTSFYSQKKQGTLISTIMNDTMVFSEAFKNSLEVVREPVTALARDPSSS